MRPMQEQTLPLWPIIAHRRPATAYHAAAIAQGCAGRGWLRFDSHSIRIPRERKLLFPVGSLLGSIFLSFWPPNPSPD
jgi:hypothetical protein